VRSKITADITEKILHPKAAQDISHVIEFGIYTPLRVKEMA